MVITDQCIPGLTSGRWKIVLGFWAVLEFDFQGIQRGRHVIQHRTNIQIDKLYSNAF